MTDKAVRQALAEGLPIALLITKARLQFCEQPPARSGWI